MDGLEERPARVGMNGTPHEPPDIGLPGSPAECHFFKLPPELRESIYQAVNTDGSEYEGRLIPIENRSGAGVFNHPGYLITQTCRQIRAEALPFYFSKHTFKFYCGPPYLNATLSWVLMAHPSLLACLRKVAFEDYQTFGGNLKHPWRCSARIVVDLGQVEDAKAEGVANVMAACHICRSRSTLKKRQAMMNPLRDSIKEDGKIYLTKDILLDLAMAIFT